MGYTPPTVIASGETWAQLKADGLSGHLERLISLQGVTAKPSVAATANATAGGATGGLLAAGTYYFVITESNGFGETLIGPESAQLTVGATNIPRITFQTLKAGNTSRNVYLGLVGGLTGGPYYLYASAITTATYDMPTAIVTTSYPVAPPTVNTTALSRKMLEFLRLLKDGQAQPVYDHLAEVVRNFVKGAPVDFAQATTQLRQSHAVFAMLSTLCTEAGVLIDANPGSIAPVATPIGGTKQVRTWA